MQFKPPKNTLEHYWTAHVVFKMRQYSLSAQKILGVIKNPKRKEEGIVKDTTAVMQPVNPKIINGKSVWKQEIWVMTQKHVTHNTQHVTKNLISKNKQIKIISAWRYPGVSPEKNPIPQAILDEIGNIV